MKTIERNSYQHTTPGGDLVTFFARRIDTHEIIVSYPAGTRTDYCQARRAYPVEAIEADFGRWVGLVGAGCDEGVAWEVWQMA